MERIHVIFLNAYPLTCSALRATIEKSSAGEEITCVVPDQKEQERSDTLAFSADVALIDLGPSVAQGFALAGRLQKERPEVKVLLLADSPSLELLRMSIDAGADGLIYKSGDEQELLTALRSLASGGKHFNTEMMIRLSKVGPGEMLTPREVDVLRMLVHEKSRETIAHKLGLAVRTADELIKELRAKLQVKTNTGLVLYAVKRQLV